MLEYPAYGRTIAAHIVRGQKPICVGVLLSTRWGYFDHVPKVCVRPAEWEPRRYEFGYLRGAHVVAVPGDDCEDQQLGELLIDLMRAGPAMLWAWNVDGSKLYDGDSTFEIWNWAFELTRRTYQYPALKAAAVVMDDAQAKAARASLKEYNAIRERAGDEAALAFHLETDVNRPERVRKLFSAPFPERGEPAAA